MSNLAPDGWNFKQLGDYVSDSAAGEWGNEAQGDQNDIPVLRSTNFTESGIIDYTKLAFRNIEEKKRIKKALKKGDILLEKSGGSPAQPVGRVVYFDRDTPHLFSNFTQKLVPVKDCDSKYLFYKLYFEYQNGTVLKFQQQTTGIINFQLAEYLGFKTIFAPLPEQQKISAILSSVDDVIEKTRAQIDKLKDLKTGMMQELLTKGVGSGGVPHTEFKDSPVGRVPEDWTVCALDHVVKGIIDCEHKTAPYVESSEYLVVRTTNVRHGQLIYEDMKFTTRSGFSEWTKRAVPSAGDVLFTREAPAGESCMVPGGVKICMGQRMVLLRPDTDIIYPFFFSLFLTSETAKLAIYELSIGTTVTRINIEDIRRIPCVVPPLEEQKAIYSKIQSIQSLITSKQEKLRSQSNVKKALMQDLLTGKVRVKVDQKESAVA
ncbi:restriction endonuclease subunit S [Marinobacter sp.]|uniref:restriction endonuclease subunit S n=1 Tax=Marinobacter sp. TaxID=50741 RepID=UPI003A8E1E95